MNNTNNSLLSASGFTDRPGVPLCVILCAVVFLLRPGLAGLHEPLLANLSDKDAWKIGEIIAHRGSSADRPENTLSSARRAIEAGATAIEIDIRTTLDGELIILHDAKVDRMTNGTGDIRRLTLEYVRSLDAGVNFASQFSGEKIPTLEEMLQLAKKTRIKLLFDLKESGTEYAKKIASMVIRYDLRKQIILGVRSEEQAKEFRELLPECFQLGFIPTPDRISSFTSAGVDMIRLWSAWLSDQSLVTKVRQTGAKLQINVGMGSLDEVQIILPFRPDAILCDNPAMLRQSLQKIADSQN